MKTRHSDRIFNALCPLLLLPALASSLCAQPTPVQLIDISTPTQPVFVGNYADITAFSVKVQGRYAYLGSYVRTGDQFMRGVLQVVDVSDPTQPSLAGTQP
jgi:hypothetical protein